MAFSDSSSVAYAAAVYVIYRVPKIVASPSHSLLPKDMASLSLTDDDSYEARLLLLKARVAPLNGMTVPRTEMNGLIIATKLVDLSLANMR